MSQVLNVLEKFFKYFSAFIISVYYARAFLCISHPKVSFLPTLIETSWPENIIGAKPAIFPSEEAHLRRFGKCKGIKQATATDIDRYGRLWALDEGDEFCSAKLLIWDLLYFNNEVRKFNL
jgi:hypothetical protein